MYSPRILLLHLLFVTRLSPILNIRVPGLLRLEDDLFTAASSGVEGPNPSADAELKEYARRLAADAARESSLTRTPRRPPLHLSISQVKDASSAEAKNYDFEAFPLLKFVSRSSLAA